MSLSTLIAGTRQDTMDDDQGGWRQYILDHLDYIRVRSKTTVIDAELMNQYRYDLRRFLKEHMKINKDIGWIVQLINGYPNDFSFVDIKEMVIPTGEFISALFQSYNTISNKKTR